MASSNQTDKHPPTESSISSTEEADDKHLVQDAVIPDMPPFSKFSINVPTEPSRPISTPTSSDRPALSSSDSGGSDSSDDDSGHEREAEDTFDASHSPSISRLRPPLSGLPPQNHPRFSRAFSLPLPVQLGHLEHPHRSSVTSPMKPSHSVPVTPQSQFAELSLELADSVQMVIQTMLQISPVQLLDPAKEQFSACALAVPTPSMSAMLTAMKNLNYISANMSAFAAEEKHAEDTPLFSSRKHNDFDIGELLQNTGDALSGSAAHAGVDLVLFHGDVALRHVSVKGDESGMSYLLAHLIRQVLTTCQRGDTIEVGLFVNRPSMRRQNSIPFETSEEDVFRASKGEDSLQCVVEIIHRFSPASTSEGVLRLQPSFSSLLSRRLLGKVGATLSEHTPFFDGSLEIGRSCKLSLFLDAGLSPHETPAPVSDDGFPANEPSLEQLSTFVDSLKGKKVHLYASSKGPFAHHLTSYLTTWGMDVSHISKEGGIENAPEPPPPPSPTATLSSANIENYTPAGMPPKMEPPRQPKTQPVSFIFIDDDVTVLKERLQAIREEQMYPLNLTGRKRPSLAAHHRPRSSPQVARINPGAPAAPVVILHFTSLANFKVTKDLIQSVLSSYRGTLSSLPEIMIIPKPAGPRRFLTALHTAVTKPVVDPFFSPIATTPNTPYTVGGTSFFGSYSNGPGSSPKTPSVHRPSGSRSNSDRSSRSVNPILENHANLPPSPLGMQESTEYFSDGVAKFGESAVKLGDTARAGVILQSPDGQPTGIFFSPRAEKTNAFSSYGMERDRGHLSVVPGQRRSLSTSEAPQVTFSSLHEATGPGESSYPLSTRPGGIETTVPIPSRHNSRGGTHAPPRPDTSSDAPQTDPQTPRKSSLDLGIRKAISISSASPPASPVMSSSMTAISRNTRRPKMETKGTGLTPGLASKKGKSPAENIVPPISVLIVDDNPINRTILSTFMKKNKIKYDVASNGKEAVEKWKTGEFHLILMDIQMPVMDGIDATRSIRHIERVNAGYIQPSSSVESEDHPSSTPSDDAESRTSAVSPYRSSVIIVALTASSLQSDRIAALGAGCNDFLTKPVSLQWLNNKLIEWGSIKALSMYADMTTDVVKTQNDQAKNIAERLYVPRGRKTPPSPTVPKPSPAVQSATSPPSAAPQTSTPHSGSSMWSPAQPSAALSFRAHLGLRSPESDERRNSQNVADDQTLPPLPTPSAIANLSSSAQAHAQTPPSSEDLIETAKNQKAFDPNASTSTLKLGDVLSSKIREEARTQTNNPPSSDSARESGSTSSVSRSPSPLTPATPDSSLPRTTFDEDEKTKFRNVEDPADLKLDPNVPEGCMELYAQGGEAQGDALVVTP